MDIVVPSSQNLVLFAGAAIVLLLIPGPAVLYIVARSVAQGRKAGLVSVLGIHAATFIHVLAAALGLWMVTAVPMLLLIAAGCTYRMFTKDWQTEPDREGLMQFVGLLVAFAAIAALSASPASISEMR